MAALRLPPAFRLVELEQVTSTNDEAKRLAREGAEEGTLVLARTQTAGRGRGGRSWTSAPGNLCFSLLLRPECPPADAAQLSFVAALGVGGALASLMPPLTDVEYKWPNDVLISGRKVAGILLEAEGVTAPQLDWLIVGVGINVKNHPDNVEFPATDMEWETGVTFALEAVLEAFARHFQSWVLRWVEEGFAPVRAAWQARVHGLGEPIRVRLSHETLKGRFAGLDDDGALLLDQGDGGRRRITAGDVFFEDG